MKAAIQLFCIAVLMVIMGGCTPEQLIRDRYMGRAILEPKLQPQLVKRDVFGQPILLKVEKKLRSDKKASRHE